MEIEKIDFWDTMKILSENAGIDITKYQNDPEKMEKNQQKREKFKLLNKRHQKFLKQSFPGSAAEIYVKEKRKLSPETIEIFGLGYGPDSHYDLINLMKEK
jgi:DNA primase